MWFPLGYLSKLSIECRKVLYGSYGRTGVHERSRVVWKLTAHIVLERNMANLTVGVSHPILMNPLWNYTPFVYCRCQTVVECWMVLQNYMSKHFYQLSYSRRWKSTWLIDRWSGRLVGWLITIAHRTPKLLLQLKRG